MELTIEPIRRRGEHSPRRSGGVARKASPRHVRHRPVVESVPGCAVPRRAVRIGPVDSTPDNRATLLLQRWSRGDAQAGEELAPLVLGELRRLAAGHLAGRSDAHTLQPTALVNEAWMRLMRVDGADYPSRGHFYSLASQAMRSLLVDHARRKLAKKRGGDRERVNLREDWGTDRSEPGLDVLALHTTLEKLARLDPELASLVELRFFGGLDMQTVAASLGLSKRTAERRWRVASAWLAEELEREQ